MISIYYYFGWMREAFFAAPGNEVVTETLGNSTLGDRFLLGSLVVATVIVGILPAALPIIP